MKLYHYGFRKNIIEYGLEAFYKHNHTRIINDLIYKEFQECFGRDYCVFLNLDKRDNGDIIVSVDSQSLNSDLLYVADEDIADAIYSNWYRGKDCFNLVREYVSSIMKLSDYNGEYSNSEVLYLDDIPSDLLKVEYINEEMSV